MPFEGWMEVSRLPQRGGFQPLPPRGNPAMNTLKDVLSHLTFSKACKLLGAEGKELIRTGGRYDIDVDSQATLHEDAFRFLMGSAMVTVTLDAGPGRRFPSDAPGARSPASTRARRSP